MTLLYNSMPDEAAKSVIWATDEVEPRDLIIKGTASVDPDVFVAFDIVGEKVLWIVKSSGFVCGINGTGDPRITAHPTGRSA